MARKQVVSTEFDRRYDTLMVEPSMLASFEYESLSRNEISLLLGRFTASHLRLLNLARIQPSTTALIAESQDMNEMATYYGNQVTWRDAREIIDVWHEDFCDYADVMANLPSASVPRL